MRSLVLLFVPLFVGCPRSSDSALQAPAGEAAREPVDDSSDALPSAVESAPEEVAVTAKLVTPAAMASQQGLMFRRAEDRCEVWNFGDDGFSATVPFEDAEAEAKRRAQMSEWERRKADALARSHPKEKPKAQLVYAYSVVGDEVVLADPRATLAGLSQSLPCEASGGNWHMEESDCEEGRSAPELGGCADAFTESALSSVFAELGRAMEVRKDETLAQAKAKLDAFQRKLPSGASVYWLTKGEGGPTCQRWKRTREDLVHRSSDGRVSYGFSARLSRHQPIVQVHLSGPSYSSSAGVGGLGSMEVRPIHDVKDDHALVGDETWYFTEAACQSAAKLRSS